MKKTYISILSLLFAMSMTAQEIEFTEYELPNGLHVILHQDNTAPVVTTSVMYHVGAKNEQPDRTGFAHFFEHLLFEGTKNIGRGKWFEIVSSNGGQNNANTTDDRTYYYEVFPSNALEVGLWMESERMLHPVIDQVGVDTQNEVVKEEKRLRVDNTPYGQFRKVVKQNLFKKHPYRWTTIGEMEHLDAATLDEFLAFNKKFYVPNNAVLVVAGDIQIEETKELIDKYFAEIPRGKEVVYTKIEEDPITETLHDKFYDANIKIPALVLAYRTPAMNERDAYVLDMLSSVLSGGKSSRLYKRMVDKEKKALQVFAFNSSQEDYGTYMAMALPLGKTTLEELKKDIDEEIVRLQTELISDEEYQKIQNKFESNYVSSNSGVENIANSLARYYMLYKDINLINNEIGIYRNITKEDIRRVAKKYLNPNQRLELEYLPKENKK
ncbi:MAG: insulinase family protein [Flavobacteriaceae bacterium]|nr:insulinase family protein [Flavobacteriaceae bacterium]